MQGIAILVNECPESYAGASKKRVRRTMLIGSCAPCDSVPRSKLEERSWLVWHEPLSVANVWALNLTYIKEFFSFARVLRHFVLVPCEICVVPFGHWKIAPDRNDISIANIGSTVVSLTLACASLSSFKHGYLSLQKCSLFSRIFGESSTISISHFAKLVTNRVSLLSRKACKHAFRHASPLTRLCVA